MSDAIKNQYQILADLKRIDEKASRLHTEIERIPLELGKLEEVLRGRQADFNAAKALFDAAEKKLRSAESDLKDKEDKLQKAEGKMMEVKTNEEYQAAIRENKSQKDAKSGLEDKTLSLLNEVEEQRKILKQVESQYKTFETAFNSDKQKLEEERAKIVKLYDEQVSKRASIVSRLDSGTAALYQRVLVSTKGAAVVQAENGMCRGCNIHIRPQLYNEILGFKVIHRCPSCGKILISALGTTPSDTELAAE